MDPLKMYIENGDIPASYVSLPEGKFNKFRVPHTD